MKDTERRFYADQEGEVCTTVDTEATKVALLGAVAFAMTCGCGSRSVGYLEVAADAGTGGRSAVATTFGIVSVAHTLKCCTSYAEWLTLSGAFFGEEYDPESQPWTLVETRQTPGGVTCDIHYHEGLGGEVTPPAPPTQVNGGGIAAWAGSNPAERLEIMFDGDEYSTDVRAPMSVDKAWPGWASSAHETVTMEVKGSALVPTFAEAITLPAMPINLTPLDPQPGPEGNFVIAWHSEAQETLIILQFYIDWNEWRLRCYPPPAVNELFIPTMWISEWTWGPGGVFVLSRNEVAVTHNGAEFTLRADRQIRGMAHFHLP